MFTEARDQYSVSCNSDHLAAVVITLRAERTNARAEKFTIGGATAPMLVFRHLLWKIVCKSFPRIRPDGHLYTLLKQATSSGCMRKLPQADAYSSYHQADVLLNKSFSASSLTNQMVAQIRTNRFRKLRKFMSCKIPSRFLR